MKKLAAITGMVVLAAVWGGPFLAEWRGSFSAHMLAHMGVVALASPLLALGISGTQWDPTAGGRWISPFVASLLDLIVVWGWHAPAMRALVEASIAATVLEQGMFLAAGLVLWLSCLGHGEADTRSRAAAGALGLLFTSLHMTLLGVLLALTPRPLYGTAEVTCFGTTLPAIADQQIGGVVMLMVGAISYLVGGLVLAGRVLSERDTAREAGRRCT